MLISILKIYKAIDKIYVKNPKETVDIIFELALDLNNVKDDTEDRISVLYNLLAAHKYNKDDVTYIKLIFRKMVIEIFEEEKYTKFRYILPTMISAGFDEKEIEKLFRKYIKTEQDPRNIEVYKFRLLSIDLDKAFPKHVFGITSLLELNEVKPHTVKRVQESINTDIREYGVDVVREYIKIFHDNEYIKETSKQVLKQIKVNGSNAYIH